MKVGALRGWARLLSVSLLAAAIAAAPAGAKNGGGKSGGAKLSLTTQVNQLVPDRAPTSGAPFGLLTSSVNVGNKFKGRRIRDVNVTLQTTGATPGSPARDLSAVLTAPNGASTELFRVLFGTGPTGTTPISIGPLTLDDEAGRYLGLGPARDPFALYEPWAGSARPLQGTLYPMDNGRVKGTWTLKVLDNEDGETSVLNFWRLDVQTGKPNRTK